MTIKQMQKNQPEVVQFLKNSYESNRVSHAYLFEGEAGCGTYEAALYMTMLLLCESENKPCFRCHNCVRIEKNNHLNVCFLEPQNGVIKREQMDEMIHELTMTSLEKGAQVGIIKEAEKMNASAANALLKLLEEPSANHYIILLTSQIDKLLDTIISRTQVIRFKPLSRKFIVDDLRDSGVELDMSYILSYITSDIEEAKQMIRDGKVYHCLKLAMEVETAIAKNKDPYVVFYKQAKELKEEQDKKWHRVFLDILLLINKELIHLYHQTSLGYFESILKLYEDKTLNLDKVMHKIDILNEYQERLNYHVNLNLFYTSLMIEMSK